MDGIEVFKSIRDAADKIIKAYEAENMDALNVAIIEFALLMIQLDALK